MRRTDQAPEMEKCHELINLGQMSMLLFLSDYWLRSLNEEGMKMSFPNTTMKVDTLRSCAMTKSLQQMTLRVLQFRILSSCIIALPIERYSPTKLISEFGSHVLVNLASEQI